MGAVEGGLTGVGDALSGVGLESPEDGGRERGAGQCLTQVAASAIATCGDSAALAADGEALGGGGRHARQPSVWAGERREGRGERGGWAAPARAASGTVGSPSVCVVLMP